MQENLDTIRMRLQRAAVRMDRNWEDITLIAVSKTVSPEAIGEAWNLGLKHFAENRVQEALPKISSLPADICWHFVGHLQTNKVRQAVEQFQLIQSVDRMKLAREVQKEGEKQGRAFDVLLQVNIGDEGSKSGCHPSAVNEMLKEMAELPNIKVLGLMTIAPYLPDPEEVRPYFQRMKEMFDSINICGVEMKYLSMGMTHDFEVAVEEGSNMIRLGTALFGKRPY